MILLGCQYCDVWRCSVLTYVALSSRSYGAGMIWWLGNSMRFSCGIRLLLCGGCWVWLRAVVPSGRFPSGESACSLLFQEGPRVVNPNQSLWEDSTASHTLSRLVVELGCFFVGKMACAGGGCCKPLSFLHLRILYLHHIYVDTSLNIYMILGLVVHH